MTSVAVAAAVDCRTFSCWFLVRLVSFRCSVRPLPVPRPDFPVSMTSQSYCQVTFIFFYSNPIARSLYVSLSISVSRSFSPFKTNHKYLRMRDCAFQGYRYTQTHTIHWHTGAPDSAVCFAANCLYSADYSSHWMYLFIRLFSFVFAPHEQICSAHAAENSRNRFFLYVSFIGHSSRVFMPFSRAKKTRRLLRFANYFRLARIP